MTLDELKDACQQMGEKPFRAKQLYDWMHHRLAGSYDEMTNLSLAFREKLKEQYPLTCLEKVQQLSIVIWEIDIIAFESYESNNSVRYAPIN